MGHLMGGLARKISVALLLLLAGCYRTTPAAISALTQNTTPLCPFEDGIYYVRAGTIDGSVIIATISVKGIVAEKGKTCGAKIIVLDDKGTKNQINNIFARRFSALDNQYQIAYQYPAPAKPDIYFVRRIGRLYEIFSECNSDISGTCAPLKSAQDIKNQTHYFVSTEKKREALIRQEVIVNHASELEMVSKVQTPNYLLVPKYLHF